MASEESEDDLHQCGRCMEIFHNISDYFDHKKKKSCDRVRFDAEKREHSGKLSHATGTTTFENIAKVSETVDRLANTRESQTELTDKSCNGITSGNITPAIGINEECVNDYATDGFSSAITTTTAPNEQEAFTSSEVNEHAAEDNSYVAQTVNPTEQLSKDVESQKSSVTYEKTGTTEESVTLARWRRGRPPKSITYNKIVQLKKPMHWNSKPRLHQCPKCSYIASFKDDYDRHLRKSHNLSAYVCYRCQKAFSDKYKLKRHLQRLCRREPPQSKAPAFIEFSKKTNHHTVFNHHTGAEEVLQVIKKVCFSCHMCIDSFDSYSAILLHLAKHPNVRPGICKFCGMWFSNRYKLRRHVVSSIHDDVADDQMLVFRKEVEKMKIVCPAGVIKSKLKRRMVTCSKCDQVFVDKTTLSNHRETAHQRNPVRGKSYFCKLCSVCFESRTKYLLHLKTSHRPATQCTEFPSRQCPVCQRKFQHLSHTNRHRMALHTARQQIPVSIITELLTDTAAIADEEGKSNNLLDENARECAEKSTPCAGAFICFVCCLRFVNKDLAREHVECHRVWMPHPSDGPVPADLFDPALTIPPIQVQAEASSRNVTGSEHDSPSEMVNTTLVNHAEGTGSNNRLSNDESAPGKDLCSDAVPTSNNRHLNLTESNVCPYCQKECSDLQSLYEHKTDDHKLICVFRCVISSCNLTFETADKYQIHSKIHSQFAFICKVCNEHFYEKQDLFSHRLSAHRHMHHASNSVLRIRSRNLNIKKQSQGIKTREAQRLSNVEPLEKFQQNCLKSENVQRPDKLCDQCGSTFNRRTGLCQHHSVPSTSSRQHVCEICSKAFNKKEHLQRHHISAHTVTKPFLCKEPGCGKAFKRKDKLQDHFKCHSSVKPYSCSICGRKYRYREGLRYHERMHEKELRYRCSNCSISFPRPSELRQHLSVAHKVDSKKEIYAYHCNICNRAFPRPERLKRHSERDHSIVANWGFRCDICCKGFAGIKSYDTHMIRHHSSAEDNGQSCVKQRKCKSKKSKLAKKLPKDEVISATALPVVKWNEEQSSNSSSSSVDLHPDSSSVDSVDARRDCHMPDAINITPVASDAFYAPSSPPSNNSFPRNQLLASHETKDEKLYSQTASFASLPSESHDRRFTGYSYTQPSGYSVTDYGNSTGNECCTIGNNEEPQYDSLQDLEADTASESNRILRCTSDQFSPVPSISLSNSSTLTYPGYPSSRISQPSSGLHSSLNFYHPGSNAYRTVSANGYPFPAEEFPSAPLPFSFARANTFTHANNKMTPKPSDLTSGPVSAQLSFTDHASVPFRPVAMPTQHTKPPTANPYANETTRFGRWFGNVPLLANTYDAKQTMLDAVRFSRLPASDRAATASHPFSMPCHDPYMTSRYSTDRQCIPRESSGNIDQRSVFMDYNFMTDDHTAMRRDEHFSHSGASALHPVSSHVPGSMPAMHVSLSLLSQQQQQFPVNDYQWPTMPMYNWL